MLNAKKVKEIDNKLTFAIGYRNLLNIVVIATGFIMAEVLPGTEPFKLAGLVLFVMGLMAFATQLRDNIDAMSVEDL